MRGTTLVAALLTSTALLCTAAPLSAPSKKRDIVRLPIRRGKAPRSATPRRRDVPVDLTNNEFSYLIDLKVGTPAQPITLTLDTGSSDIWAFSDSGCDSCEGGTYDPSSSSSSADASSIGPFDVSYFDGSSASGFYVTDDVSIGGADLTSVYLGVATGSSGFSGHYGIMGIGPDGLEGTETKYPGILDDLVNQGVIDSASYSIYLDDIESSTGSIDFGGIDDTKYSGDLVALDIIPYTPGDNAPRLQVEWTSLSLTDSSGETTQLTSSDLSYPVAMDTGYTTTVLPDDIFNTLSSYFDVTTDDSGNYIVDCTLPDGKLTYGFGSGPAVTIDVPFSELAVPTTATDTCLFGFLPQGDNVVISFGDTFLRSTYANFDFGSQQISLAQAVWT